MNDQVFGITDTGKQRKNNEDTFIAESTANSKFIIACVIDGVGGYSGGEVAAELARESILRRLNKPSGEIIPMIIDCFKLANDRILQEKQNSKEHNNMACVSTLAIADIEHNQFYYAHIGDTRLYLVRDQSLVKLSHDQSFVGFLEDSGRLSEAEAMNHPKRNEINKALGLDMEPGKENDYIETGQSPFLPGDMLLLCSDGLTDMLDSAKIRAIVTANSTLKEKCQNLIEAANNNGGKDNITVVLVQNNKAQVQYDVKKKVSPAKKNYETIINAVKPTEQFPLKRNQPATGVKSNRLTIVILSVLIIVLLAVTVGQYLQNQNGSTQAQTQQVAVPVIAKKPANKQEIKLQYTIDHLPGHTLILSDTAYTSPVLISQAIRINKDSLLIKVSGKIVLQCDSGYTGEAVRLSPTCKQLVLDSVSFTGFQTAVVSYNNALALKNTRFINCGVAVQNMFTFANKKYINGKLPNSAFKTDSLPLKNK